MSSAAAFAAQEAVIAGEWDNHLGQLLHAVQDRLMILDRRKPPTIPLPPGQVWAWMNEPMNRWEPRGTGVIFP